MAAAFLGMFLLGGCESEELEQRSFPLAVGVDVQGKPSMEDGKEAEPKLVVSFDFPDLAQISEKGKAVDTPMSMSLEGEDLFRVEKSYENNTNRVLDYNHIKAIVFGENLISDSKRLRSVLLAWSTAGSLRLRKRCRCFSARDFWRHSLVNRARMKWRRFLISRCCKR